MSGLPIDPDATRFRLDVQEMDRVHSEFITSIDAMAEADRARFLGLFDGLVVRTAAHLDRDEQWMIETRFPALQGHRGDPGRAIADNRAIGQRSTRSEPDMGRAYGRGQFPARFAVHAATMDSALAASKAKPGP